MFLFTNGELDRLGAGLALHVAAPVELALAPFLHSGEEDQHYLQDCDNFDDALGHSNGNIDDDDDNISSASRMNKSERLKKGIMDGVRMRW